MPKTRDIAIDLGTANTLVYVRNEGILVNEPTIVAMNERTGEVLAIGNEAWSLVDRSPSHIRLVRPLQHGAITDFEMTERLIKILFQRVGVSRLLHPRALVCVSSGITPVERRAVEEAAASAGARSADLIAEPMAAALGAGLPIDQPAGNCVVDVGGGTTEIAIISMGGIVASRALRVGGLDLDDAIQKFLRTRFGIAIGDRTAEAIKREIGSAIPQEEEPAAEIRGRELQTGMPKTVTVGAEEVRAAIEEHVVAMIGAVRDALAEAPPELSHDVLDRGMHLTGGTALLRGLARRIEQETSIPIHTTESPLETVVVGAGRALSSIARLRDSGVLLG
jgi:rod shape-determining protein MreB